MKPSQVSLSFLYRPGLRARNSLLHDERVKLHAYTPFIFMMGKHEKEEMSREVFRVTLTHSRYVYYSYSHERIRIRHEHKNGDDRYRIICLLSAAKCCYDNSMIKTLREKHDGSIIKQKTLTLIFSDQLS